MGTIDLYPTYLRHSPNGHHFAVCNQKEFAIIKTASFKSVILGNGTNLVWHNDSDFAVLDGDTVNLYQNFESSAAIKVPFTPHRIFEGELLTIAGPEKVLFYEWHRLSAPANQLEMNVQKCWWSANGALLAVASA